MSKLNLKIQNIFLKNKNACKNPALLLLYLGENVKKFALAKIAQNFTISLGYFIF
jgi:hypothetical protein